ncbi:hypothetical protein VTO73DRAFT_5704 [Trametes versicolor]
MKDPVSSTANAARQPPPHYVYGKGFKPMDGRAMRPIPVDDSLDDPEALMLSESTLQDNHFQPLKDVQPGKRKLIPLLQHNMRNVLERPGVHWIKDPDTGEYNFPKYLETIPQVADFAFDRLPGFVPSSQDKKIVALAKKANCKFAGSTSSLTGILVQIYLLLSEEKYVNIQDLSDEFKDAPRFFTPGQRMPVSVILNYQDGVYTTDYDGERDESKEDIILLPMGTLLEKFFTLPKKSFDKFRKTYTGNDHPKLEDTHRYAKHEGFLLRSQLDCRDDSLPGSGVFDLKTRAISVIRHDVYNYQNYLDHNIETLTGWQRSFEKEYYDMIRSAFLEYSFQARIGGMDGVFVAYHNTARIFGLQYISLREMDSRLFGREDAGDRVFLRCVTLMARLYREITSCFPNESVKVTFEKRLRVVRAWVEPLVNPDPSKPPPVVELQLHINSMMHGRRARGQYAVYSDYPWTVQYRIERSQAEQEKILLRRDRAYGRQMSIAHSLPNSRGDPVDSAALPTNAAVEDAVVDPALQADPVEGEPTILRDEGTL